MTVGKILLQILAIAVAIALLAIGYASYRNRQVTQFKETKLERLELADVSSAIGVLNSAPSMVCVQEHSDFNSASRVVSYHHEGKTRIAFEDLTSQTKAQHWIMLGTDIYIWTDDSESIVRIDASPAGKFILAGEIPPLYTDAQCSVWWNPDDEVFRMPESKPIIGYRA